MPCRLVGAETPAHRVQPQGLSIYEAGKGGRYYLRRTWTEFHHTGVVAPEWRTRRDRTSNRTVPGPSESHTSRNGDNTKTAQGRLSGPVTR